MRSHPAERVPPDRPVHMEVQGVYQHGDGVNEFRPGAFVLRVGQEPVGHFRDVLHLGEVPESGYGFRTGFARVLFLAIERVWFVFRW